MAATPWVMIATTDVDTDSPANQDLFEAYRERNLSLRNTMFFVKKNEVSSTSSGFTKEDEWEIYCPPYASVLTMGFYYKTTAGGIGTFKFTINGVDSDDGGSNGLGSNVVLFNTTYALADPHISFTSAIIEPLRDTYITVELHIAAALEEAFAISAGGLCRFGE